MTGLFSKRGSRLGLSTTLWLIVGLGTACNGGDASGRDCSPGEVDFCFCPGDSGPVSGTQTCRADGSAAACNCEGASGSGSESKDDSDGGSGSSGETSGGSDGATGDASDLCGNGVFDPGECAIDPDGHLEACPEDCALDSDSDSSLGCDDCPGGTACFEGVCVGTGELRISLSWDYVSDLDLHVVTPGGDEISFVDPAAGGGVLDVDDCVGGECLDNNSTHVENIFFPMQPQAGEYRLWVNNFDGARGGPFEIQVSGAATATFTGSLPASSVDSEVFGFGI